MVLGTTNGSWIKRAYDLNMLPNVWSCAFKSTRIDPSNLVSSCTSMLPMPALVFRKPHTQDDVRLLAILRVDQPRGNSIGVIHGERDSKDGLDLHVARGDGDGTRGTRGDICGTRGKAAEWESASDALRKGIEAVFSDAIYACEILFAHGGSSSLPRRDDP